jgi:hypothetical protein
MLAGRNHVRRKITPALIILAGGLVLGVLIGVALDRSGGSAQTATSAARTTIAARALPADSTAGGTGAPVPPVALPPASAGSNGTPSPRIRPTRREVLGADLNDGVRKADALGGEAAAAVWVYGDAQPILGGPVTVPHRMWSMSKAVVTIAALQATQDRPDPVLQSAITDAIRRSDNCAVRRVIVGLQDLLNEGVAGTISAFEQVLAMADARIERAPQSASAEQACVRYLIRHQGSLPSSDLGVVPQFGTAEWTEDDAIAFAHSLADGAYGAPGAYLLQLMGLPKEPPLEEPPPPSAPPLDWGAGAAFPAGWKPAWKAGWGGSQNDPPHFLAGQIVVLHIGEVPVAVTAIFVPKTEPANDNPGITQAPEALELMFKAARAGLEREKQAGSIRIR